MTREIDQSQLPAADELTTEEQKMSHRTVDEWEERVDEDPDAVVELDGEMYVAEPVVHRAFDPYPDGTLDYDG